MISLGVVRSATLNYGRKQNLHEWRQRNAAIKSTVMPTLLHLRKSVRLVADDAFLEEKSLKTSRKEKSRLRSITLLMAAFHYDVTDSPPSLTEHVGSLA